MTILPTQKIKFRKLPKLRKSASESDRCFACLRYFSNGELCLAHPNEQDAGKGMKLKAIDYLGAIVCPACHDLIDGRAGHLTRQEQQEMHHQAHRRTLIWWFENGYLRC